MPDHNKTLQRLDVTIKQETNRPSPVKEKTEGQKLEEERQKLQTKLAEYHQLKSKVSDTADTALNNEELRQQKRISVARDEIAPIVSGNTTKYKEYRSELVQLMKDQNYPTT